MIQIFPEYTAQSIVDEITQDILMNFNTNKHDVGEFLNVLTHDISNLNNQLFDKKLNLLKQSLTKHDQTDKVTFQFLKFDTIDPFFSKILGKVYDFILVNRRNFFKCLSKSQIHKIIDLILTALSISD